jgi:hypothetical protein
MIGILKEHATIYMYVVSISTLLLFGLPLTCWPLRWAGVLGWRIPDHTHLAVYFGRCLGGVICAIACFAIITAENQVLLECFYQMILLLFLTMVLIHIYGAVKRIQPVSETIEIAFWIVLIVLSLMFYPGSRIEFVGRNGY